MTGNTAFCSANADILNAYDLWAEGIIETYAKRAALSEQYGRELYVNNVGFSHGTMVVGFERFDSDNTGDLLADGALIVSNPRGQYDGMIVPNLKRKAGKEFDRHLREYTTPTLTMTGMPGFHIAGSGFGGMASHRPAILKRDDHIWVMWGCDGVPVDTEFWQPIPLSSYYAVREAYDAEQEESKS